MNHRLASLCLAALLTPVAAEAQTFQINPAADPTASTFTFKDTDCGATLVAQWQLVRIFQPSNDLLIWATTGSCGDTPVGNDVQLADISVATLLTTVSTSGTFNVQYSALPGFSTSTADGGVNGIQCGTLGATLTQRVCGAYPYASGTTVLQYQHATSLALTYDTKPPAPPTISSSTALDGTATVSFTVDSDTASVTAEIEGPGESAFRGAGTVASTATNIGISGLVNGSAYLIRLLATDAAGNVSAPSSTVTVTPVATVGFGQYLQDAGITEPFGCGVAGAQGTGTGASWSLGLSALLPLAALALARTLRRRSQS